MTHNRITSLIAVFLIALQPLVAQTFTTQAPKSVSLDETFRVQYVLSTSDGDAFHCPQTNDFDILGGPSTSTYSSMQWVNGKRSSSSSITYTYILQAKRSGKFQLPRPTVKVDGKTLHASAATITITEAGSHSQQRQAPRSADDDDTQYDLRAAKAVTQKDLFVKCIASKTSLVEQEPVVLSYKVYARAGVGLSNIVPRRKPEMKGFWTQEVQLPNNLKPSYETIGGNTYRVFTYMQYVAFPQQTGQIVLPPLQNECSVIQRDPNLDAIDAFFNGGGSLTTQLQRSSESVTFNVTPLPTPKPNGFSGGVGSFDVEGKLLSADPATHDVATYRITISGQGNMRLIQAPTISFPKSFDTYDTKTTDETRITYEGIAGKIKLDYTFVPRKEGDYEIPATQFVYFDIPSGAYRTITLPATKLHVKKGMRSEADVERELALRQGDIRPDHTTPATEPSHGWSAYLIWLIILLVLTIVADRALSMPIADKLKHTWRSSTHSRNKHLNAAEEALKTGDAAKLYTALEQAFTATDIAKEDRDTILSRRYAPDASTPENLKATMEAARKLLTLILLFLLPNLGAYAEDSIPSMEPVHISVADSIYNAGNEAFRMKEYGKAVLCYSRALWIDPDNEDARYNIALVQTRLEDQFSTPQEMFFFTWTREVRTVHSMQYWLQWSIFLFFLIVVCIVCFRHTTLAMARRVAFYVALICVAAFVVTNTFAAMQYQAYTNNQQAVIMSDEAACFDSPVAHNKASLVLHAGTLVTTTDTYGKEWTEIQLPDTRRFWVRNSSLERVRK